MSQHKLIFSKPYTFEGKEYTEVDLSGIENLTGNDLMDADRQFNARGNMAIMNEMTVAYSCIIASKSSKLPEEFFQNLPAKEVIKVKNTVMGFLNE